MSAVALSVLLVFGAAPPGALVQDEVRARVVTRVDAAGYTRAAWFLGADGEVNFSFFDKGPSPAQTGLSRVHFWLRANSAGISFSDKGKGAQAALSVITGTPHVALRGDDGKPRVLLALSPEHGGSLNFYDKNGPNVGAFTENTITLHGPDSRSRVALSRTSRSALLDLTGNGKSRVTLAVRGKSHQKSLATSAGVIVQCSAWRWANTSILNPCLISETSADTGRGTGAPWHGGGFSEVRRCSP